MEYCVYSYNVLIWKKNVMISPDIDIDSDVTSN